jgi:hypothetical protein
MVVLSGCVAHVCKSQATFHVVAVSFTNSIGVYVFWFLKTQVDVFGCVVLVKKALLRWYFSLALSRYYSYYCLHVVLLHNPKIA